MPFLVLFGLPALVGIVFFRLLPGITWQELLVQMVAQMIVAGLSVGIIYHASTSDMEVLNGIVTGKESVRVHCGHSYQCHCHQVCTGSGKQRSCHRQCSTCYRHPFDQDWHVDSSLDQTTLINRIDPQGLREPARWTVAQVGEPYAAEHSYLNYIKAAPGSLFRRQGLVEKYTGDLPPFPAQVEDYYRRNALVLVHGALVSEPRRWNRQLAEINGRLGASKKVDVALVLVRDLPQEYFYALEQHWIGAKKNSAVLVIGVGQDLAPRWATVMSWTTSEILKVRLRDAVMDLPRVDRDLVLPLFEREVVAHFLHRPMKDFAYLASSIAPTPIEWAISMLIGLLISLGLTWAFHRYDVFGTEHGTRRNR